MQHTTGCQCAGGEDEETIRSTELNRIARLAVGNSPLIYWHIARDGLSDFFRQLSFNYTFLNKTTVFQSELEAKQLLNRICTMKVCLFKLKEEHLTCMSQNGALKQQISHGYKRAIGDLTLNVVKANRISYNAHGKGLKVRRQAALDSRNYCPRSTLPNMEEQIVEIKIVKSEDHGHDRGDDRGITGDDDNEDEEDNNLVISFTVTGCCTGITVITLKMHRGKWQQHFRQAISPLLLSDIAFVRHSSPIATTRSDLNYIGTSKSESEALSYVKVALKATFTMQLRKSICGDVAYPLAFLVRFSLTFYYRRLSSIKRRFPNNNLPNFIHRLPHDALSAANAVRRSRKIHASMPLPQGQFTPLPEALCWVILDLTSSGQAAVLERIRSALQVAFPDIQRPSQEIVYDALAKLMADRKFKDYGIIPEEEALERCAVVN
ncbi:hypothetical protein C0J52_15093 [Blattella germanica]|nr:hypothetical protein C0J52_15093 [Blattella germanica]